METTDCPENRERMHECLDSGLPVGCVESLRAHLELCPSCRRHWEELHGAVRLLSDAQVPVVCSQMAAGLRERVVARTGCVERGILRRRLWVLGAACATVCLVLICLAWLVRSAPHEPAPQVARQPETAEVTVAPLEGPVQPDAAPVDEGAAPLPTVEETPPAAPQRSRRPTAPRAPRRPTVEVAVDETNAPPAALELAHVYEAAMAAAAQGGVTEGAFDRSPGAAIPSHVIAEARSAASAGDMALAVACYEEALTPTLATPMLAPDSPEIRVALALMMVDAGDALAEAEILQ
jgi:hypothetical protein